MKFSTNRMMFTGLAVALLAACTAMPTITTFNHAEQLKLSSASHWKIIAEQVSQDVKAVIGGGQANCVRVDTPDPQSESQFQTFLAAAVTHQLISAAPSSGSVHIYSIIPTDSKCNVVTLRTVVIEHKGPVARPYPGKYTLLAAGLVGIRHVVRAFSEARFVGTVAAAELAFWASAGFHSGDTVTELAITTSYVDPQGMYLAENTNVYYIDTSDSALYRPRAADASAFNADAYNPVSHPKQQLRAKLTESEQEESGRRSRRRRLEVHPETISVCDTTAEFLVSGEYLATRYPDFMLGTIVASGFGANVPENTDARQSAQVKFVALNKANVGLDEITLSMIGSDGLPSTTYVSVSGDPKACSAAKVSAPGIANLVLTPAATGTTTAEICRGPWSLVVSGANAGDVKTAKIASGNHIAKVTAAGDGKTVTLEFEPLTEYRTKRLPSGDTISIQLTDSHGAPSSKSVPVTCQGQQIKADSRAKPPPGTPQHRPPKQGAQQPAPAEQEPSPQTAPQQATPGKTGSQQATAQPAEQHQ